MIEDTLMVSEAYGDSAEAALKHALQVPKTIRRRSPH
jgi:hypothetical protein